MPPPYLFYDKLVLRTPRFPLTAGINEQTVRGLLHNPAFLEALYLASPVLYEQCMKWEKGLVTDKKEIYKITCALVKYYTRMTSRCTPFGLFSGCAVLSWGEEANMGAVEMDDRIQRHTRLDMHYLCALAQKLASMPALREKLLLFPNNSLYTIGDEIRYIEYSYVNAKRSHQISSVITSPALEKVLQSAAHGSTREEMARLLTDDDISEAEALAYIEELTGAQLLVSELEPAITGAEFIYQLMDTLKKRVSAAGTELVALVRLLEEVDQKLAALDGSGINGAEQYREIMALLNRLELPYEAGKLFQADMVRLAKGRVGAAVRAQLYEGLAVLNRLTAPAADKSLQSFITRFRERYEDREMPLLEVLDTETGIGYAADANKDLLPLVQDIRLPEKQTDASMTWGKLEKFLSAKLSEAQKTNARHISIDAGELDDFPENWHDMPPSLSVMFRIVDKDPGTIFLEAASGPSAACLLGRFAHADPDVKNMVCDITKKEQENNPAVIYAEIIHLPESRTGNILLHPPFRDYEIPYLAKSSLPADSQVTVQDIWVSVKNNRIVLRSARLNREIIPRLSTAHNFSYNALPVYQFLCDLQHQGARKGFAFNWGSLRMQHVYLPRVVYKNVVLSLASWSFQKKHLEPLTTKTGALLFGGAQQFRAQWQLPRYVVWSEGDNALLVDFDNPLMVEAWAEAVKNKSRILLQEFLYNNGVITDGAGNAYSNQLVAVCMRSSFSEPAKRAARESNALPLLTRKFTPGSEWLYYKFYCGTRTADKILLEAIGPLTEELLHKGQISQWFFIRYNDPAFHLRVRFHVPDATAIGEVMRQVHDRIHPYEQAGTIWRTQMDTYNRELERYGSHSMALAETLFYHDSVAVIKMLGNTAGDEREHLRWLWALRSADEMLNSLGFLPGEKLALLLKLKEAFDKEFDADKALKEQLKIRLRENRKNIDEIMNYGMSDDHMLYPLVKLLEERTARLAPVVAALEALRGEGLLQVPAADLAASYIHMALNRVFVSRPRVHELVMYDFLYRYYQSLLARQKQAPPGASE